MAMTLDECVIEWNQKHRRMGCNAATKFVTDRVKGFKPKRFRRYMPNGNDKNGQFWEHVVATDGHIIIDLAPYADKPRT